MCINPSTHVLLLNGALLAVVRIGDTRSAADHASALVRAVVAFVANAHQRARPHVRVTDDTLAIALLAQPANGLGAAGTERERGRTQNGLLFIAHNLNAVRLVFLPTPGCLRQNIKSG